MRVLAIVEKIPPSAAELWHDAAGSLESVWEERRERAEELVLNAAMVLQDKGLTAETAVTTGKRRRAIALEAKSWCADMIIDAGQGIPKLFEIKGTPDS